MPLPQPSWIMSKVVVSKILFALAACAVLTGLLSPPLALAVGIAFGMLFVHPFETVSRDSAKLLLQFSVVALGFGMNFSDIFRTGRATFLYTAVEIIVAMAVGLTLGKIFKAGSKGAFLITAGTAICGGSAIAAIATITNSGEDELAMSMGTVFTLNSAALFIFPVIGIAMHLTQTQFGLWSALAIHDTSSVVGAAVKFGPMRSKWEQS